MLIKIQVTGKCQHNIYKHAGDPCLGCGICTIDGNDYSAMKKENKPHLN